MEIGNKRRYHKHPEPRQKEKFVFYIDPAMDRTRDLRVSDAIKTEVQASRPIDQCYGTKHCYPFM